MSYSFSVYLHALLDRHADFSELKSCATLVTPGNGDRPPMCLRDLSDDSEAKPGAIRPPGIPVIEYLLTVVRGDARAIVLHGEA